MAEIRSFRDPVTNRLKAWGRITANQPGDLVRIEPEGFSLDLLAHVWQWNGSAWIAVDQPTLDGEKLALQRQTALDFLNSPEGTYKLLRAAFDVARDEVNILRLWTFNFKSEVAAAASLADLKNRVALLPTLNDRTLLQFKNAIENKIGGGSVDAFAAPASQAAAQPVGLMAKIKNFFVG